MHPEAYTTWWDLFKIKNIKYFVNFKQTPDYFERGLCACGALNLCGNDDNIYVIG